MADLHKSLVHIKGQNKDSYGYFQGIERKYFPKWEGWEILDYGGIPSEYLVDSFYKEFFWGKLKMDLIDNQYLADLLMAFAVVSGKKKAINKLQRVLKVPLDDILSIDNINKTNSIDIDIVFLGVFAECVEFYVSMKTPERIKPLLGIYYNYLRDSDSSS